MLKQILELNGAKKLKKEQLLEINGGGNTVCQSPGKWCRYGHIDDSKFGDVVCCGYMPPNDEISFP